MEITRYFEEKRRMNNGCYEHCDTCILSSFKNGRDRGCKQFEMEYPEEAKEKIENWSKTHPIKSRRMVFKEMFPDCNIFDTCPNKMDINNNCINILRMDENACVECKTKYWDEEEAPKNFGKGKNE